MSPEFVEGLINKFKSGLNGGNITKDHRDFILIKELYSCKPSDLDNEEERVLDFHFQCLMLERKNEYIQSKKTEQKQQVKKILAK